MAGEAARKYEGSSLRRTMERRVELTAEDLVEAVRSGDEAAGEVWDCVCKSLAVACVNIQHVLNVELIILGGGMADAGAILLDSVRGHFAEQSWTLAQDQPQIELARLGNDAGIVGGAKLAFDTLGSGTGTILKY
jgi:glucokinase